MATRLFSPIHLILKERAISRDRLAKEPGYSTGVIYRVIAGVSLPSPKIRAALSGHLGLPESELFND